MVRLELIELIMALVVEALRDSPVLSIETRRWEKKLNNPLFVGAEFRGAAAGLYRAIEIAEASETKHSKNAPKVSGAESTDHISELVAS